MSISEGGGGGTVVIGLGNPLMADDGLGIAALERLRAAGAPSGVELVDGGTWGMNLLPVIEAAGTISRGMTGMGFIYANKECISLGIGCLVSDFQRTGETPYGLLDRFKRHPSVAPLIEGSEVKEYSAHLIPEGGFKAIPQLFGEQFSDAIWNSGFVVLPKSGYLS